MDFKQAHRVCTVSVLLLNLILIRPERYHVFAGNNHRSERFGGARRGSHVVESGDIGQPDNADGQGRRLSISRSKARHLHADGECSWVRTFPPDGPDTAGVDAREQRHSCCRLPLARRQ